MLQEIIFHSQIRMRSDNKLTARRVREFPKRAFKMVNKFKIFEIITTCVNNDHPYDPQLFVQRAMFSGRTFNTTSTQYAHRARTHIRTRTSKLVGGCLAVYRLARRRQGLFVSFSHACVRVHASIMPRNTQPGELVTTLDM